MRTARMTWIGFFILLLVALLLVGAMIYWQHITGMNYLHVIAQIFQPDGTHGC